MESKSVCREIIFNLLSYLYRFLSLSSIDATAFRVVRYIYSPGLPFPRPGIPFPTFLFPFFGGNWTQSICHKKPRERERERERESGLPPAPLAVKAFPSKAHFSAVAVNMSIDWGYYDSAEECTPTICAVIGEVPSQILALIIMCIAKQLSIQLTLVNGELEIDCSMHSIRKCFHTVHTKSIVLV